MPPSTRRAFGFEAALQRENKKKSMPVIDAHGVNQAAAEQFIQDKDGVLEELTENGKPKRIYQGLGSEIGPVVVEDGNTVDAGRLLMRNTWNAALPTALDDAYREGQKIEHRPDVWIHKNRMSGLWGSATPCTEYLEKEGIKTLLFAGVNTDQCVGGSLQDAFTKGWDCILLKDAVSYVFGFMIPQFGALSEPRDMFQEHSAPKTCLTIHFLSRTNYTNSEFM